MDHACHSCPRKCCRNGQSNGSIAREEKRRLGGIIGYSCLKRASRGWQGKRGPLLSAGAGGGTVSWQCEVIQPMAGV